MAVGDMDNCPHHPKQKVVLFCQTCDELICTKCISRNNNSLARHQDHVYLDLMDAYDIIQEDMLKIVAKLRDSVDTKRQQRQETLVRIQKLKFALLRKKGFVSKECRSLNTLIKSEEHHFNRRLERVIGTALECEERAHKELDYDTVSREGLIGTADSVSKISPFRCNSYLRNITRLKKEILEALMRDEEGVVLGSGELWTSQIHRLRDVTLHVHGEKKALGRAFHFPTEAPSAPHVLPSWCVVGASGATLVWKYKRAERVDRFKVTLVPVHLHRSRHLRAQRTLTVKPVLAKRNHVVLRDLAENCEYRLQVRAVNCAGEGPAAEVSFYTHARGALARQGRVWAGKSPAFEMPLVQCALKWLAALVVTSLVLLGMLWLVLATFERHLCGVLLETPPARTPEEHLGDMCPMPEQMRVAMMTKAVEAEK